MKHDAFRLSGKRMGFTLIEMLVVLGIVCVVVTAIAAALSAGLSVWGAARDFDSRRMQALLCFEEIEQDVRNSFPFYGICFRGDRSYLRFPVIAEQQTGDAKAIRTIAEIGYEFEEARHVLWRYCRRYPFTLQPEGGNKEVVLSDVQAASIFYGQFVGKNERRIEWKQSWAGNRGEMPACVRMDLLVGAKDESIALRKTVYLPVENADDYEEQAP